ESQGVPDRLRQPVLSQSADRSRAYQFTWTDPAQAPAAIARFSPFELSGWAAVAQERDGEQLTPQDIVSADSDRYIELRIMRRIPLGPLLTALPAVGLLGRFDPDLLRAALPALPDFDEMFSELRQQEWISRRGPDYYEIDEALGRRLLAYCEQAAPQ